LGHYFRITSLEAYDNGAKRDIKITYGAILLGAYFLNMGANESRQNCECRAIFVKFTKQLLRSFCSLAKNTNIRREVNCFHRAGTLCIVSCCMSNMHVAHAAA